MSLYLRGSVVFATDGRTCTPVGEPVTTQTSRDAEVSGTDRDGVIHT